MKHYIITLIMIGLRLPSIGCLVCYMCHVIDGLCVDMLYNNPVQNCSKKINKPVACLDMTLAEFGYKHQTIEWFKRYDAPRPRLKRILGCGTKAVCGKVHLDRQGVVADYTELGFWVKKCRTCTKDLCNGPVRVSSGFKFIPNLLLLILELFIYNEVAHCL